MKKFLMFVFTCIISVSMLGCGVLNDWFGKTKGDLVGQRFTIKAYDDHANNTMNVSGTKVSIGLMKNEANDSEESSSGFKSQVLDITVNGNQMLQVGNTLLFEEDGLDLISDYDVPKDVTIKNGGGFVPLDRSVNKLMNAIGKKKVIIISSQQGVPIGVYQGNDVYVTVPSDLPKMTRLNIDGKSLYIHRANYIIMDSKMLS